MTNWFKRTAGIFFAAILFCLLLPSEVHAFYIDPGTGSLIIQVIVGFLIGGLVAVKMFWNNILISLRKKLVKRTEENEKP